MRNCRAVLSPIIERLLVDLKYLATLDLWASNISDDVVKNMAERLLGLESLNVEMCWELTDAALVFIGKMEKLKELRITCNEGRQGKHFYISYNVSLHRGDDQNDNYCWPTI